MDTQTETVWHFYLPFPYCKPFQISVAQFLRFQKRQRFHHWNQWVVRSYLWFVVSFSFRILREFLSSRFLITQVLLSCIINYFLSVLIIVFHPSKWGRSTHLKRSQYRNLLKTRQLWFWWLLWEECCVQKRGWDTKVTLLSASKWRKGKEEIEGRAINLTAGGDHHYIPLSLSCSLSMDFLERLTDARFLSWALKCFSHNTRCVSVQLWKFERENVMSREERWQKICLPVSFSQERERERRISSLCLLVLLTLTVCVQISVRLLLQKEK